MAKLLIAGYGFLGKTLKTRFRAEGWVVDALSFYGSDGAIGCDLSNPSIVNNLQGDYDLIIHCAATQGGGVNAYRAVYLDGCRNLLARFPSIPLIFTSSTSVYGQVNQEHVTESCPAEPATETASILLEAEELALTSGGVVIRLSALCGPGRCHTLKSFLNGSARINGAGERMLNFVHRDDASSACALIANHWREAQGEIFNVSAISVSQLQCYQAMATYYRQNLPIVAKINQSSRRRGASTKIVVSDKLKTLGWHPRYFNFLKMALVCGDSTSQ